MDQESNRALAEAPRGTFAARVDEKGRLKLPAEFHRYLQRLGEEKVFITSFDTITARIYPISVWKENERFFAEPGEEAQAVEDIAFLANVWGADSEIDAQGRVLIPAELRREMKIENQQVHLDHLKGRLNVYSQAVFEERKRRAIENSAEKLKALERRGLK